MVIQTASYFAFPVNADAQYQLLAGFDNECKSQLGFDPTLLGDLCDALARTLWREACYDKLLPVVGECLVYDCDLQFDSRRKTAPRVIHSINGKALVEFMESDLIEKLSIQLRHGGYPSKDCNTLVKQFVKRFCGVPGIDHSFRPLLFVPLAGNRLGVDLLLMQEYHELCRCTVLSDDGETGRRKGGVFEDLARSFIIRELGLPSRAIPVKPKTKMRKLIPGPVDYGDVDFAFIVGTTLVHLDMKSACRKPAEFRGDCSAIESRVNALRAKMLKKVEPRGSQLASYLRGKGVHVEAVLNFLCVGVAEYIPPSCPELRYGEIPRAVTPRELVSIVRSGVAVAASS
jgi:hypothetical protein